MIVELTIPVLSLVGLACGPLVIAWVVYVVAGLLATVNEESQMADLLWWLRWPLTVFAAVAAFAGLVTLA